MASQRKNHKHHVVLKAPKQCAKTKKKTRRPPFFCFFFFPLDNRCLFAQRQLDSCCCVGARKTDPVHCQHFSTKKKTQQCTKCDCAFFASLFLTDLAVARKKAREIHHDESTRGTAMYARCRKKGGKKRE